jgi:hypothetical protein
VVPSLSAGGVWRDSVAPVDERAEMYSVETPWVIRTKMRYGVLCISWSWRMFTSTEQA